MMSSAPLSVRFVHGRRPPARWQRASMEAIARLAGVAISDGPADLVVDYGDMEPIVEPPLGIWRYGFGDGAPFADGAAGTIARLYRSTGDPGRAVLLREGWFRGRSADSPGTSDVGARVASWGAALIARIAAGDRDMLDGPTVDVDGCREPVPPPRVRPLVAAISEDFARWRRRERWTIGTIPAGPDELLRWPTLPQPDWLRDQPSNVFYADPFPLSCDEGRLQLLAEEYDRRSGKGSIVELLLDANRNVRRRRTRYAPAHHVSYPFLLRDGERAFFIPESAAAGRITAVPTDEGDQFVVMDRFSAVDPTLVRHNERWWLFCTNRDDENQTDLYVYFSESWTGPWTSHPLNPVKSDARSSRPAGAFFQSNGGLYRPAQNCSRRYGGGIAINRVVELSPTRFREEPVRWLSPNRSWAWPDGLHTLNFCNGIAVVDGLRVERG